MVWLNQTSQAHLDWNCDEDARAIVALTGGPIGSALKYGIRTPPLAVGQRWLRGCYQVLTQSLTRRCAFLLSPPLALRRRCDLNKW